MSITKNEVISFFITAAIFGGILFFLLGWPRVSNSMGSGESNSVNSNSIKKIIKATPVDNFNGVNVYYNGPTSSVAGRNMTADGYNLGLKYQCVEFIKRYYYEYYNHKMPDSYGHAKDFFDQSVADGLMNRSRGLRQFTNGSISRPRVGDILVFAPTPTNKYGHIGIISKSGRNKVEMVHQNAGPGNDSRSTYQLVKNNNNRWVAQNQYILGWLRRS